MNSQTLFTKAVMVVKLMLNNNLIVIVYSATAKHRLQLSASAVAVTANSVSSVTPSRENLQLQYVYAQYC